MHRTENNLLWRIVFILVVLTIQGTCALHYDFEVSGEPPSNWTEATTDEYLAKITTLNELCDANAYLKKENFSGKYWTALRLTKDGKCQWTRLNETSVRENCIELLHQVQPGQCYVISIYPMKLQPQNCSNSNQILEAINDGSKWNKNTPYTDECREYKTSSCLHGETYTNSSRWKALRYPWSCHEVASGELIGNCEIRRKALKCCDYYCRSGNLTYTNNIGANLIVAVQKLPAGFREKVEIVFETGDMISLASEVFNNTVRIIVVTLQITEEGMLTWKQSNNYTLRSNVIGVELSPPYNKTLRHLINITYSHAKWTELRSRRTGICHIWSRGRHFSLFVPVQEARCLEAMHAQAESDRRVEISGSVVKIQCSDNTSRGTVTRYTIYSGYAHAFVHLFHAMRWYKIEE